MSNLRTSLGICVAFALFSASCKPDKGPTPQNLGMKTEVPTPEVPIVDGVYGALYSLKIYETKTGGDKVKSESATATFYDVPSNTATATQGTYVGDVYINNYNLSLNANNEYGRTNTEGNIFEDLAYEENVTWYIEGDDGFEEASFAWTAKFPVYDGTFPTVIDRSKDLTFVFDTHSGSVSNYTDSVFVVIAAGDKKIVRHYGCSGNQVVIPASELTQLQACPLANPGYLQISTAVIDIFPLEQSGNPIVLVKQVTDTRPIILY